MNKVPNWLPELAFQSSKFDLLNSDLIINLTQHIMTQEFQSSKFDLLNSDKVLSAYGQDPEMESFNQASSTYSILTSQTVNYLTLSVMFQSSKFDLLNSDISYIEYEEGSNHCFNQASSTYSILTTEIYAEVFSKVHGFQSSKFDLLNSDYRNLCWGVF